MVADTVEEEKLGIILNATKVGSTLSPCVHITIFIDKVASNISSSSAIDMANSSTAYEDDLYRSK